MKCTSLENMEVGECKSPPTTQETITVFIDWETNNVYDSPSMDNYIGKIVESELVDGKYTVKIDKTK